MHLFLIHAVFCCSLCYFFLLILLPLLSFLFGPQPSLHVSILCLYAPRPPSSPVSFQSLLFMKVNLWVYQEPLAGGGLHCSNHNKALPSTWKRDSVVGILGYFHQPALHLITHSYLQLSANEPHCFFLLSPRDPASYRHISLKWMAAVCLLSFILYSSIQHLFFIGLQGAVSQRWARLFNRHMFRAVFHTLAFGSRLSPYAG